MAQSVLKLVVDSKEYDKSLKGARKALDDLDKSLSDSGKSFENADRKLVDFAKSIGKMQSSSTTLKGKVNDLKNSFVEFSSKYNQLTDAEKRSPFGKALAKSLDELKTRFKNSSNELSGLEKELGGMSGKGGAFSQVLGDIGGKLGLNSQLTGMLTTGTIGMTAAVTAGAAAVGAAAKAWADYNTELAKSQQDVTVITGLKGEDADELTVGLRALVSTYDVDFREAVNAANTLMTQFGVSGETAFDLLRAGMQGMLQGDGPKLLSMIQQYAPAFNDAGVEASQLIAVIQNSEGGLFTEQNMNAIVMGIKNIRLMTDQTSEALAKLGIDGADMTRKLNEGTMTIFDALKEVSSQIDTVGSGSQAAGEVMQQVFGRQGTAAGTKLGEAIASLNLNLDETKLQTGEVGEGFDRLVDANRELEQAMYDCFGYKGWHDLAVGIKTELVGALTFTIETINEAKKALQSLWNMFSGGPSGSGGGSSTPKPGGKGGEYSGDVYVETTDSRGNVIKATHNGIDVTDQAQGVTIFGKRRVTGGGSGSRGGRRGGGGGGSRGGRGGGSHQETSQEKAEKMVSTALQNYAKTISMADMMLENGMINTQDYKKKELAAQERLASAYAEAYNVYHNEDYKANFEKWSKEYRDLADVVKGHREEFEKATEELMNMPLNLSGDLEKLLGESMEDYAKRKNISLDTGSQGGKMPHGWGWADESAGFLNDTSSALGQIAGGIEDLGIELPEGIEKTLTVMQAIAAILTGISSLVMIITTINATKSIPIIGWALAGGGIPRAAGGMLGGNSFSGDNIPVLVNSGELILNRAQQGNLASQLGGSGITDLHLSTDINAESLRIVLNNNGRRTGRGEYVTTNKRG